MQNSAEEALERDAAVAESHALDIEDNVELATEEGTPPIGFAEERVKEEPETGSLTPAAQPESATPPGPSSFKKKKTSASTAKSTASSSKSKKASSSSRKAIASSSSVVLKAESPPHIPPPINEDDEEDNTLYCICQLRQDDVEGGMIMCDRCDQWYHYRCMSITEDDVELVDQFICPPCQEVTGEKTTYKSACARGGCRRASRTPFSKYCSDHCGLLEVIGKIDGLKVRRDKVAMERLEGDRRVAVARKTEAFTQEIKRGREWETVVAGMSNAAGSMLEETVRKVGVAGAFALMVAEDEPDTQTANGGLPNGVLQAAPNGISSIESASTPIGIPSATNLIGLTEQLSHTTSRVRSIDLEKSRINSRLDRLDLRSTLLHLVSDRVPTLSPAGSSATSAPADEPAEDEDMPDADADAAPKKTKKKKGSSNSKSKSTESSSGGPRCGYDQRLHWDDSAFDTWAQSEPGRSILAYETPLDGVLDDEDGLEGPKVVCGLAKRKCRRHLDWSNLCELSLDAEKATLNAESRTLTQTKLELTAFLPRLKEEKEALKEIIEEQARREKLKEEVRDRDLAMTMAAQGTRRAVA